LVADPSDVVRQRLVARLRECGIDVVAEATSLAELSAAAARVQPKAIVTDILFPDGRGPVVVHAARSSAPRALLVVLTNTVHYRQACLELGVDSFLDKSTDFDEVAPTLRRGRANSESA
jgi:DNA-binding NarL/FixJ family response regulator